MFIAIFTSCFFLLTSAEQADKVLPNKLQITIFQNHQGYYYTTVKFPFTTYNLILDLEAPFSWVPAKKCAQQCAISGLNSYLDCSISPTCESISQISNTSEQQQQIWEIQTNSYRLTVNEVVQEKATMEVINIEQSSSPTPAPVVIEFSLIDSFTPSKQNAPIIYGVLGLQNADLLESFSDSQLINDPSIITFDFPSQVCTEAGYLQISGQQEDQTDESKRKEQILLKSKSQDAWHLDLRTVIINGEYNIPIADSVGVLSIILRQIIFPHHEMRELMQQFRAGLGLDCWLEDETYQLLCRRGNHFPALFFDIGGEVFVVKGEQYIEKCESMLLSDSYCRLYFFQQKDFNNNQFVLGRIFYQNYRLTLNYEQRHIQLEPANERENWLKNLFRRRKNLFIVYAQLLFILFAILAVVVIGRLLEGQSQSSTQEGGINRLNEEGEEAGQGEIRPTQEVECISLPTQTLGTEDAEKGGAPSSEHQEPNSLNLEDIGMVSPTANRYSERSNILNLKEQNSKPD